MIHQSIFQGHKTSHDTPHDTTGLVNPTIVINDEDHAYPTKNAAEFTRMMNGHYSPDTFTDSRPGTDFSHRKIDASRPVTAIDTPTPNRIHVKSPQVKR